MNASNRTLFAFGILRLVPGSSRLACFATKSHGIFHVVFHGRFPSDARERINFEDDSCVKHEYSSMSASLTPHCCHSHVKITAKLGEAIQSETRVIFTETAKWRGLLNRGLLDFIVGGLQQKGGQQQER